MIYGNEIFFTKEHIESQSGHAPKMLCELVVYSLELVSQLSATGLKYRFKGGNSLLILLEDPMRFSIDVDIVTDATKDKVIEIAESIAKECQLFSKVEIRQHKTKPWLPMISFKFFFDSLFQSAEDAFVMLDVVLEPAPYPGQVKQVKCLDIYSSNQQVEVPTIAGLIGDKLLTMGPATLGIPIGKGKEAQRLKHVFDVSLLSRQSYELDDVMDSIKGCMIQEMRIQKNSFSLKEVIDDTILFLSKPMSYGNKPPLEECEGDHYLYETVKGFEDFRKHLFKIDYTWEMFRESCSDVVNILNELVL